MRLGELHNQLRPGVNSQLLKDVLDVRVNGGGKGRIHQIQGIWAIQKHK